jgi:hypothetical protein
MKGGNTVGYLLFNLAFASEFALLALGSFLRACRAPTAFLACRLHDAAPVYSLVAVAYLAFGLCLFHDKLEHAA